MAAVKRHLILHHSAVYIFISFGIIEPILVALKIEYHQKNENRKLGFIKSLNIPPPTSTTGLSVGGECVGVGW